MASPPAICDCCGDFSGLAAGGNEKALISLAALRRLDEAELNRRDNSPNSPAIWLEPAAGFPTPRFASNPALVLRWDTARCRARPP